MNAERGDRVHAAMIGLVIATVVLLVVLGTTYVKRSNAGQGKTVDNTIATVDHLIRTAGLQICLKQKMTWTGAAGAKGGAFYNVALRKCNANSRNHNNILLQVFASKNDRDNAVRQFEELQSRRRLDGQAWSYDNAVIVLQGPTSDKVSDTLQTQLKRIGAT
ncbi:MAG: hypothetical protein ACXVRU_08940 [Gaiellaceae bacterium]